MLNKIEININEYLKAKDLHQYKLILDAASIFIKSFPNGVNNDYELTLGIDLFRQLVSITMIASLHQYEYNYDLQNEILYKKLAVFRICIPSSHSKLRKLTEMLVGMKEGEMDLIIPTLTAG